MRHRLIIMLFAIIKSILPSSDVGFTRINDKLSVNWVEYDFGEILIGRRAACDLILKNTSSEKIQISCLIPGCHCITVKANHKIIKPSKTLRIHVIYDTTNKQKGYTEQRRLSERHGLDKTRLSGIPQCPQIMDDAYPELGHYLTTTGDNIWK